MKRIKKHLQKLNNRGFTLVEMIVSFMLIGLFMVAASKVIGNTAMVYYEAKGITDGMQVSSIISSKIRGEIEAASEYTIQLSQDDTLGGGNGTAGYNKIDFVNASGSHIYIGVDDKGYMFIYYYPVLTESGEMKDTSWTFDKKAYMGYTIKELKFSQPKGDYDNNIIYMTLTLTSPKYGDYTVSEYIQCYNFKADTTLVLSGE